MIFRDITAADLPRVRKLLAARPEEASDSAFAYQYPITDSGYSSTKIAFSSGCFFYRWNNYATPYFSWPYGDGDRAAALADLAGYCDGEGLPLVVCTMDEAKAEELPRLLPRAWRFEDVRDEYDYVYRTADLAGLSGRAYQARRRLVNRFVDQGDWSYSPMTDADIPGCLDVLREWHEGKLAAGGLSADALEESAATGFAVSHHREMGLVTGVLRQSGRVVAFVLGEALTPDMMLEAFEKARPSVPGAFAMLGREFARQCSGYRFVNRSWDAGEPGLRRMKEMYRPCRMIRKLVAR